MPPGNFLENKMGSDFSDRSTCMVLSRGNPHAENGTWVHTPILYTHTHTHAHTCTCTQDEEELVGPPTDAELTTGKQQTNPTGHAVEGGTQPQGPSAPPPPSGTNAYSRQVCCAQSLMYIYI